MDPLTRGISTWAHICVSFAQHPLEKLRFLFGKQGAETYPIGGCWEPIDGPDPLHSPRTLIATAVRTFKDATGIDLAPCTQWVNNPLKAQAAAGMPGGQCLFRISSAHPL